ncbi:MAG TPA: MlaD family protein [Streptosporangiaceae bacterium]|nr:MlaD family protein [Streptosporangiaceae bacterium]
MRRKSIAGPLIKSAVFIVVTAVATAILAISIANISVAAQSSYRATFTDVTGLTVGSSVDIAGVRVGQVTSIGIYGDNLATVGFTVLASRSLPASVTATIKYQNLVGQRYIELDQGTGAVGKILPPGGTIPLHRTTPALDLTELFNGFEPLYQALSPGDVNKLTSAIIAVFQGEAPDLRTLVATVGSLTTTLAARTRVIDEVITNLNSVLSTIGARNGQLAGLVQTLKALVSGLAADREPIGGAITAISNLTSATAGLLKVGRAPLKADIIRLGKLASNLNANSSLVASFLTTLPVKLRAIGRLASYGSWVNFYLCSATVTGVHSSLGGPASTGVHSTAARCS